jgi:hypothetical protein
MEFTGNFNSEYEKSVLVPPNNTSMNLLVKKAIFFRFKTIAFLIFFVHPFFLILFISRKVFDFPLCDSWKIFENHKYI